MDDFGDEIHTMFADMTVIVVEKLWLLIVDLHYLVECVGICTPCQLSTYRLS